MIVNPRFRAPLTACLLFATAACGDEPSGPERPDVGASDARQIDAVEDVARDTGRVDDVDDISNDADADAAADTANADDTTPEDTSVSDVPDARLDADDAPLDTADAAADTADADVAPDVPIGPCRFATPMAPDADRPVMVGYSFGPVTGERSNEVGISFLRADGNLETTDFRLDVGFRAERIEFFPSGDIAVVMGDRGELASVQVTKTEISLIDTMTLDGAGYGDLRLDPAQNLGFAVSYDSADSAGIHSFRLNCDGTFADLDRNYFLRLAGTFDFLPDDRALLVGGQVLFFDPVDEDDVRLLERDGDTWRQVAGFDVWSDSIDALRMSTHPDGIAAVVPNGSPFSDDGNTLQLLGISGDSVTELQRVTGVNDVREAHFSNDGNTVIATLFEPGVVAVYRFDGSTLTETERISGVGLIDNAAFVRRGPFADQFFVTAVQVSGDSVVTRLQVVGEGDVDIVDTLVIGSDVTDVPNCIATVP